MTTDPRGRWFRVYARQVRQHPKFRDLNAVELGAWLVLRSEAELRDGAVFADRAEAIIMLRRRRAPQPARLLDRLLGLALFDAHEDGSLTVHDREDHDRPKYPSDDPEKVRGRVKKHRQSKGNESGNEYETIGNETETISPAGARNSGAEADSFSEGGLGGDEDNDLKDAADAYYSVTGRFPSDRVLDWLNRLSRLYSDELFGKMLAKVYMEDSDPRTLLSRTEERLKALHYSEHRDGIKAEAKQRDADMLADIKRQHEETWERTYGKGDAA